jgi:predicted transcriptional regulator
VTPAPALSRRERQIMDVLFERGRATAAEVHARLPDAPSLTAVRTLIRILEDKGHVRHTVEGRAHVYAPATPRARPARPRCATWCAPSSAARARRPWPALLDDGERPLTAAERDELAAMMARARAAGR